MNSGKSFIRRIKNIIKDRAGKRIKSSKNYEREEIERLLKDNES